MAEARRSLLVLGSSDAIGKAIARRIPPASSCPTTAQPGLCSRPPRPAGQLLAWRTSSLTPDHSRSAAAAVSVARFGLRIVRTMQSSHRARRDSSVRGIARARRRRPLASAWVADSDQELGGRPAGEAVAGVANRECRRFTPTPVTSFEDRAAAASRPHSALVPHERSRPQRAPWLSFLFRREGEVLAPLSSRPLLALSSMEFYSGGFVGLSGKTICPRGETHLALTRVGGAPGRVREAAGVT
jgi:hypothetical protein